MTGMDCKHALITGGSRGLGLSLAKKLARRGVNTTLIDVLDCTNALEEVNKASNGRARAQWFRANVTDSRQMLEVAKDAVNETFGPIDLVVANAGISGCLRPIYDSPSDEFAKVISVNVMGVVNTVKAVLPGMLQRRRGHVLIVSSFSGSCASVCMAPYVTSKFAVRGFADVLRLETMGTGVLVHVAMPCFVATPMVEESFNREGVDQALLKQALQLTGAPDQVDQVTELWVKGIQKGHYIMRNPKFSTDVVNHVMAGLTAPGVFPWPLDIFLAPVLATARHLLRFYFSRFMVLPPHMHLPVNSPTSRGEPSSGEEPHEE